MQRLIEKCPPGVIVDPFAGSGTTGRACKDLGRKCVMIELEERYAEIAARRMMQEVIPLAYEKQGAEISQAILEGLEK